MKLGSWIQSKPALMGLAALCLALALVQVLRMSGGERGVSHVYYWDLGSGELFTAPAALAPIDAPSGPSQGVLAMVFSCGKCDEGSRFVAWLEQHTPEARRMLESGNRDDPRYQEVVASGHQIAAAPAPGAAPQWNAYQSPQAAAVTKAGLGRCEQPRLCTPGLGDAVVTGG
jgi:hypothetical protein